jgi:hypothetical protein
LQLREQSFEIIVTLVNVFLKIRTHGLTSDSVTIFYVTDELLITIYIGDITLSSVVIFIIMCKTCKTQGSGIWGGDMGI